MCTHGRPLSEPLFCLSNNPVQLGGQQPASYSEERHLLRTLCLVSRQLRQVVEPILYQEFMPGYGEPWCYNHYTWDRRLTAFMRTVAHRRDLAAHVRRIYIHPHLITDLGIEEPKGDLVAGRAREVPPQTFETDYPARSAGYPPRGCPGTRGPRPTLSFRRRSASWFDGRAP